MSKHINVSRILLFHEINKNNFRHVLLAGALEVFLLRSFLMTLEHAQVLVMYSTSLPAAGAQVRRWGMFLYILT